MKVKRTLYIHSNKEYMYSVGKDIEEDFEIKISKDDLNKLSYAIDEISIDVEIDTETGDVKIICFDDKN